MSGYVQLQIDVDDGAFADIIGGVETVLERFNERVAKRIPAARQQFQSAVRPPDDVPALPFVWSYDAGAQGRARRWWFAHLKEMGLLNAAGGRYKRSGDMVAGWDMRLVFLPNGGFVQVFNNADGAEYVYGERQVPSHTLTGWGLVAVEIDRQGDLLADGITQDWFVASGDL